MLEFYFKGLLIGIVIALPLGPVGVLCLQRTISSGVLAGLLSGLAAAVADSLYGAAAAFGLHFISRFLDNHHFLIQIAGGVLLCGMGALMLRRYKPVAVAGAAYHRLAGAFVTVFLLALTNPMTLAAFLAIFAGLGVGQAHTQVGHAATVVAGVFCGSMLWWIAIAFGGGHLRQKVMHRMPLIQRCCGGLLLFLGVAAVAQAL